MGCRECHSCISESRLCGGFRNCKTFHQNCIASQLCLASSWCFPLPFFYLRCASPKLQLPCRDATTSCCTFRFYLSSLRYQVFEGSVWNLSGSFRISFVDRLTAQGLPAAHALKAYQAFWIVPSGWFLSFVTAIQVCWTKFEALPATLFLSRRNAKNCHRES